AGHGGGSGSVPGARVPCFRRSLAASLNPDSPRRKHAEASNSRIPHARAQAKTCPTLQHSWGCPRADAFVRSKAAAVVTEFGWVIGCGMELVAATACFRRGGSGFNVHAGSAKAWHPAASTVVAIWEPVVVL